jgi:DNA processing protein
VDEKHPSPWAVGLVALMKLEGFGRRSAFKLTEGIPSPRDYHDLYNRISSRLETQNASATAFEKAWSFAEEEMLRASTSSVRAIAFYDEDYPERLKSIPDPPAVIFVLGKVAALNSQRSIAIVGTREPTSYGISVAKRAARTAAEHGFAIVSGLAHGCDTYAHIGCVEAKGTGIGVLAHGLDRVYPAANKELAKELLSSGGCLVSEYPLGVKPFRNFFAERDRIQSGLSEAVLVIETDIKGGTMHTVRFAAAQHREVACISHPGEWLTEEKTRGNQQLIRSGRAVPIGDTQSLVEFLGKFKGREVATSKRSEQLRWQF